MTLKRSQKPHLGIFGRRNVGKSSFVNVLTGQNVAIVSEQAGTTTDPVDKAIEITGLGPAVVIDTAGIDDCGEVGGKRVRRTVEVIATIDLAILVISDNRVGDFEDRLMAEFRRFSVPFFVLHNKRDLSAVSAATRARFAAAGAPDLVEFSTLHPDNLETVVETIRRHMPETVYDQPTILGDLVSYGDVVLLITPIDVQAPAGRLILPQVQVIRDCLDNDCITVVLKEREVDAYFRRGGPRPALAVTDSQAFLKAAAAVPAEIPLTSFSILFARYRGPFADYVRGTATIDSLEDGDRILILESCTHHVAGDDIGRVKIPRWLTNFTGRKLEFDVAAGLGRPPRPLTDYRLVVQCGGCMLTRKQVMNRLMPAIESGIPVTNYGMVISYVHGIYERAMQPFLGAASATADYL